MSIIFILLRLCRAMVIGAISILILCFTQSLLVVIPFFILFAFLSYVDGHVAVTDLLTRWRIHRGTWKRPRCNSEDK